MYKVDVSSGVKVKQYNLLILYYVKFDTYIHIITAVLK